MTLPVFTLTVTLHIEKNTKQMQDSALFNTKKFEGRCVLSSIAVLEVLSSLFGAQEAQEGQSQPPSCEVENL